MQLTSFASGFSLGDLPSSPTFTQPIINCNDADLGLSIDVISRPLSEWTGSTFTAVRSHIGNFRRRFNRLIDHSNDFETYSKFLDLDREFRTTFEQYIPMDDTGRCRSLAAFLCG